jgi:hypothetical protein
MKYKILPLKYIIISLLFIFITDAVTFSQETDTIGSTHPKFYIGITAGPSQNQIINKGILSLADLRSDNNYSFSGTFELGYFFSKSTGLSTGLGYNSFTTGLSLNSYTNRFNSTDSENEDYERRVTGSDIKELQKISFLNIPFCINFQIPAGNRFGFFIQAGVNLSIPTGKTFTSSGTFTFTGFYPAYNVLLQNLPDYGFVSNSKVVSNGNLELKPVVVDGLVSAGFHLFISEKIRIALGVTYNRSLSNISEYTSPEKFQLSSDVDQIKSIMGGSSKTTTQSVGLSLSFRYYIR